MGCDHSQTATKTTVEQRRTSQKPKAPVLLFYLPGPVRETVTNLLAKDLVTANDNTGTLNIRFVDAQNQRAVRRYWLKELQTRRDCASFVFLADLRDHPTLLLNARTLNWFLRMTYKNYDIPIVTVYNEKSQLDELKMYLPPMVDLMPICEKDTETLVPLVQLLHETEVKFNDQRRTTTKTTTFTGQIL